MRRIIIGILGSTLALGAGASITACGGGGGGKATSDEMVKAVVDALAKKDKAAFMALYANVDMLVDACPGAASQKDKIAAKAAEHLAEVGANFDECAKLDWSKAKVVGTHGGEDRKPDNKCPEITKVKDIEVQVDVAGAAVEMKLDDPIRVKGSLYLMDDFDCGQKSNKVDSGALVADVKPPEMKAADAPPAAAPTAPAAEAAPAAPATGTGNAECDKFASAYEKCIAAMPESARGPAQDGLKQMKDAFSKVPDKSMLGATCTQAYDTVKASMATLCPGVF
ncbi:MAG: hypothetical protein U1F43_14010 [Myxococcota bacterium]